MPQQWRKVLYEDQGVPDNYVDKSFLAQMRKNIYVRKYRYWNVVIEAGAIQVHICCNLLFVAAFAHMHSATLAPGTLLLLLTPCAVLGYAIFRYLPTEEAPSNDTITDFRSGLLFILILLALTPVLRTLTESISTDTIFAMAAAFLLADVLFFNYGLTDAMVSKSISLNAALFAAVCLTSRLDTNLHAFACMASAMLLFGLRPPLMARLANSERSKLFLTTVLSLCTGLALLTLSFAALFAFLGASLAILLLCPFLLTRMQSMKNNIYGPWDEAMVVE